MIATPFFLKNIGVKNNELVWNGNNNKFSITDDGNKVALKYNDNIIIADASSQEVNTKYIEILNNHSKYLVNGYELQQDTKAKMYGNENNYWRNKK